MVEHFFPETPGRFGIVRSVSPGLPAYPHLVGEEDNPLVEAPEHLDWILVMVGAVRHQLAGSDVLVTGNIAWFPPDDGPAVAPDLLVIPGLRADRLGRVQRDGRRMRSYRQSPDDPVPTAAVEVASASNSTAELQAKAARYLLAGVHDVLTIDPERSQVRRWRLEPDGAAVADDALGAHIDSLEISFVVPDVGGLAICCPGGHLVHPGFDPYGWIVHERGRADVAEARADDAEARADARAEAKAARLEATLRAAGLEPHD